MIFEIEGQGHNIKGCINYNIVNAIEIKPL